MPVIKGPPWQEPPVTEEEVMGIRAIARLMNYRTVTLTWALEDITHGTCTCSWQGPIEALTLETFQDPWMARGGLKFRFDGYELKK